MSGGSGKPFVSGQDPFTSLGKHAYSFMEDDLIQKPLVVKVSSSNANGSGLSLKSTVAAGKESYSVADELKLWFKAGEEDSWVWLRLKKDSFKIHYEPKAIWRTPSADLKHSVNLGFSLVSNRVFSEWTARAGATLTSQRTGGYNSTLAARVKANRKDLLLYGRAALSYQDYRLAAYGVGDLNQKALIKKGFLLGFSRKQLNLHLRTEDGWNGTAGDDVLGLGFLGKACASLVYKSPTDSTFGLEAGLDLTSREKTVALAFAREVAALKGTFKCRLDNKLGLDLGLRLPLLKKLTLTGTFSVSLGKPEDYKGGLQVELNV
jgi:hypothetical protein